MRRVRIPADVARVLETHLRLGHAARRALWLSEKQTQKEVETAVRAASTLKKRAQE